MTSNLKILFILDYAETGGGATRMMLWVASSMADLGCEVSLCSISRSRFLEESLPPRVLLPLFRRPSEDPDSQTQPRRGDRPVFQNQGLYVFRAPKCGGQLRRPRVLLRSRAQAFMRVQAPRLRTRRPLSSSQQGRPHTSRALQPGGLRRLPDSGGNEVLLAVPSAQGGSHT